MSGVSGYAIIKVRSCSVGVQVLLQWNFYGFFPCCQLQFIIRIYISKQLQVSFSTSDYKNELSAVQLWLIYNQSALYQLSCICIIEMFAKLFSLTEPDSLMNPDKQAQAQTAAASWPRPLSPCLSGVHFTVQQCTVGKSMSLGKIYV